MLLDERFRTMLEAIKLEGDDPVGWGIISNSPALEGSMEGLILTLVRDVLLAGHGSALDEVAESKRKWGEGEGSGDGSQISPANLSVNLATNPNAPDPSYVLEFIKSRRAWASVFDEALADSVRGAMVKAVLEGFSQKKFVEELRSVMIDAPTAHLETIAQTESTLAYNEGRLMGFVQESDWVPGVRLMAVGDSRTTPWCLPRNGLMVRLTSPILKRNIPPLHYRCRSMLSPIVKPKLRRLVAAAGFLLPEEFWAVEEAKWAGVPEPMQGFGLGGGGGGALALLGA